MTKTQHDQNLAQLQDRIFQFAIQTNVEDDSFLLQPISFDDPEQIRYCIDGLTLAFITYCYHQHPRGENYYEVMQALDQPNLTPMAKRKLRRRADAAAAKQIPFIITLNKLLEEYVGLRRALEQLLPPDQEPGGTTIG
ncbi:MAG: hypothetical protein RMM98_07925 [Acidobacteriota bacterium]|nr:hypothetical protein [Blastocatellia bacterium]MDW8239527.1 hypothetical protein [Acidobacteriota bacterium]